MGLIAKNSGGDFEYTPTPAGNWGGVCVWMIDMGIQETEWSGEKKQQHRVLLGFELDIDEDPPGENDTWIQTKEYTMSLNEKANLCKDLENWRGRPFTLEEAGSFDLRNVLDKPCLVNIVHETSKSSGKQYSKIEGITPIPRGMEKPTRKSDLMVFDMDDPDWEVFDKLSEYRQNQLKAALNFPERTQCAATPVEPGGAVITDDDIPF